MMMSSRCGRFSGDAGGTRHEPRRSGREDCRRPGHDLNKNTYHSLELTRRLDELAILRFSAHGGGVEQGFHRRDTRVGPDERLEATLATDVVCLLQGARLLRVHDVAETVAAVRITEAILGWRPPLRTRHNLD
jgi:dihydropteroate synthase